MNCKNCDTLLAENFCSHCGQKTTVDKITFKEAIHDFLDSVFSVNAPLLITAKLLFVNPGKLFRGYIEGKRKRYYKPVHFFILTTIVYLVIKSLLDYNPLASTPSNVTESSKIKLLYEAGRFMFKNIDKILFFFVLSLGLSLKCFFYKKQSLAEFTMIAFYLLGVYTLFTTLNIFLYTYVTQSLTIFPILLMLFYFSYTMVRFFQKRTFLVLFKSVLTYIMAFLLYLLMGFGFSLLVVWIKSN